jgi:hypothetical protein
MLACSWHSPSTGTNLYGGPCDIAAVCPARRPRARARIHAARLLLHAIECGQPIDAAMLPAAMEHAAGASDSEGGWDWKSAYDACAAAAVRIRRMLGGAMAARAGSAAVLPPMLARMAPLLASHSPRFVEGEELQRSPRRFRWPLPRARPRRSSPPTVRSSRRPGPGARPAA